MSSKYPFIVISKARRDDGENDGAITRLKKAWRDLSLSLGDFGIEIRFCEYRGRIARFPPNHCIESTFPGLCGRTVNLFKGVDVIEADMIRLNADNVPCLRQHGIGCPDT